MSMILYGYFRSSAAYRMRIALNLKRLDYEQRSIHLRNGEQRADDFLTLQPQGLVPVLQDGDAALIQSPAMLEYLDEAYPDSAPLLPSAPVDRARVRAISDIVCCDIHPLGNLRVLQFLQGPLGIDQAAMTDWFNHWIRLGFDAIETLLADDPRTGRFCHGDHPGMADVCLVPQVFNSRRHDLDLTPYPTISRIWQACEAEVAFAEAHPSRQPDAE